MKLRNKILSYTLPLILIPFVLTALAVYYFVIRANQIEIQEERNQRLNEVLVGFGEEITSTRKDVALISNVPAVEDFLQSIKSDLSSYNVKNQEVKVRKILEIFFEQNPYYLELTLVDGKGMERIKISKLSKQADSRRLSNEEYFRRALIEDSFQSPVREIHPQVFATIFAKSIVDDEFLGMVVLSLNTEVFARSMRPLLKRDIMTFLFDDRGLVLASAFKSSGYSNLLKELNLADEASNILTKSSFELEKKEVSYGERRFQFSVLPSESFLSSGGIDRGSRDGEKWFLGVLEPGGSMRVPVSFQIFFFSLLFLVVGAVLWVTAKASRRITIPLEKVSAATNTIGRGVSDLKLDIKTGDEVEDLANAVTKMNSDLHDYQKQLVQAAKLATMGEMTSEISHEIQNRISGISLWLQHLDSEVDSDDPRHEYIG